MNQDDFERQLRAQPIRPLPPAWRGEILPQGNKVHSMVWLRELLWPDPVAWAALAAIWLVILGANLIEPPAVRVQAAEVDSREQRLAVAERRQLWLEMMEPAPAAVASRSEQAEDDSQAGPRSDKPAGWISA